MIAMALVAKKSVTWGRAVRGKLLVVLLVASLLDAEGAAVPGICFRLDRAVAVVTLVL